MNKGEDQKSKPDRTRGRSDLHTLENLTRAGRTKDEGYAWAARRLGVTCMASLRSGLEDPDTCREKERQWALGSVASQELRGDTQGGKTEWDSVRA